MLRGGNPRGYRMSEAEGRDARDAGVEAATGAAPSAVLHKAHWPLVVLFAAALAWAYLAQGARPPDPDVYYHFRYAERLTHGFIGEFPWMLSELAGSNWVDHNLLYHVALIPFTFFSGPLGIRLGAAFFAALMLTVFAHALRRLGARPWWLWTAALVVVAPSFMARMLVLRGMAFGVLCVVLFVLALLAERERLLALVCYLFGLAYHSSIIVIPLTLLYLLACRLTRQPVRWRLLLFAGGGFLCSLILNPYFPRTFDYLFFHLLYMPSSPFGRFTSSEWTSDPGVVILGKLWPVLLLLFMSTAALASQRAIAKRHQALFLLFASCLFLAGVLRATRFMEYFCPLATLLAGVVLGPALTRLEGLRGARVVAVVLALGAPLYGFRAVRARLESTKWVFRLDGLAAFVRAHVAVGERLTNLRWDLFPQLFYHLPEHRFTVGGEPSFLFYNQPRRAAAWIRLQDGKCADCAADLALLDSRYVVLTGEMEAAYRRLDRDRRFRVVYGDREVRLYELVRPGPQAPGAASPR